MKTTLLRSKFPTFMSLSGIIDMQVVPLSDPLCLNFPRQGNLSVTKGLSVGTPCKFTFTRTFFKDSISHGTGADKKERRGMRTDE